MDGELHGKILKQWLVKAYSSADMKYCFSRCIVFAKTRKQAINKAIDGVTDSPCWNASAGHIMTASPTKLKG